MTPTEQDEKLREKISHRFDSVCAEGHQQSCGEYQTAVDDVMQLITADRKRVALEARLDELNNVRSMWTKPRIGDIKFGHWLHYRQKTLVDFAELKAKQEKL